MKSERRHELQHNDLLVWVNNLLEAIKPYSTLVMLLIVLVAVSFAGWKWWTRQSRAESAQAWDELFGAAASGDPTVITDVAEQHPNSEVGQWASLVAAEMYLTDGSQKLFDRKVIAAQELRKAVDGFLGVLAESRSSTIRERATFGLAKAYESLAGTRQSEGELEKALQYYQELTSTWPDGPYTKIADQRIQDLQRKSTKEFYDKFAQYDPQPAFTDQPGSGSPPPELDLKSLDEGTVPDHTEAINPSAEKPAAAAEGESAPPDAASETMPAPEAPAAAKEPATKAEDAKSSDKPAETPDAKPAETGPEKPADK